MGDDTPRAALDAAARQREVAPGRPEDGPYPATVGEVADEVVSWIWEMDTTAARGLAVQVLERLAPEPRPAPASSSSPSPAEVASRLSAAAEVCERHRHHGLAYWEVR